MFNSFHLVDVKDDLKNPDRKIYIFNDTCKLQDCIDDYQSNKVNRKFY